MSAIWESIGASPYTESRRDLRFTIFFDNGQCTAYRELTEPPYRNDFDFIFEFPVTIFEGVAVETVDTIDAGLKDTIKITGDMRILIQHAEFVNVLHAVYAKKVETTWPKGKPACWPAEARFPPRGPRPRTLRCAREYGVRPRGVGPRGSGEWSAWRPSLELSRDPRTETPARCHGGSSPRTTLQP